MLHAQIVIWDFEKDLEKQHGIQESQLYLQWGYNTRTKVIEVCPPAVYVAIMHRGYSFCKKQTELEILNMCHIRVGTYRTR